MGAPFDPPLQIAAFSYRVFSQLSHLELFDYHSRVGLAHSRGNLVLIPYLTHLAFNDQIFAGMMLDFSLAPSGWQ
jgi:hypothetical protein